MTALYDSNPDISHRKRLAPERAVACPRSGKRLQVQTGPDSAGSAEKTGDPRGAWSAEAAGSRPGSRPPLSLHSPEARAGSPSAEAPRGRRLQRRGRRRIMPQRSWPGRVDPDPLGSARLAPVGPVCGKQQPSRRESPTPRLKSRDERPRNWTRRGQDAAPAPFRPHRPGLPGGGSGGGYGELIQHRASKNSAVLGEEVAAFTARLRNGDSPGRVARKRNSVPTGRREGHAA